MAKKISSFFPSPGEDSEASSRLYKNIELLVAAQEHEIRARKKEVVSAVRNALLNPQPPRTPHSFENK